MLYQNYFPKCMELGLNLVALKQLFDAFLCEIIRIISKKIIQSLLTCVSVIGYIPLNETGIVVECDIS